MRGSRLFRRGPEGPPPGVVALPVTPENLERIYVGLQQSARAEGHDRAVNGVRQAVRTWFVALDGRPAAEDPDVRALLDELDPGWRRACGVGKET